MMSTALVALGPPSKAIRKRSIGLKAREATSTRLAAGPDHPLQIGAEMQLGEVGGLAALADDDQSASASSSTTVSTRSPWRSLVGHASDAGGLRAAPSPRPGSAGRAAAPAWPSARRGRPARPAASSRSSASRLPLRSAGALATSRAAQHVQDLDRRAGPARRPRRHGRRRSARRPSRRCRRGSSSSVVPPVSGRSGASRAPGLVVDGQLVDDASRSPRSGR